MKFTIKFLIGLMQRYGLHKKIQIFPPIKLVNDGNHFNALRNVRVKQFCSPNTHEIQMAHDGATG